LVIEALQGAIFRAVTSIADASAALAAMFQVWWFQW
jgi:hypothetical protein